jgi:hypothetical protein
MPAPNDLVLVTSGGVSFSFKPSQFIRAYSRQEGGFGNRLNVQFTGGDVVLAVEAVDQPAFITAIYTAVNGYYTAVNA